MNFTNDQLNHFRVLTERISSVIFIPHQNADGDAVGSILGWCNLFKKRGVDAIVVAPDLVSVNLRWMKGADDIIVFENEENKATNLLNKADLFFLLDFNDIDRCGNMAKIVGKLSTPRILIDHHPSPVEGVADVMFSETSVSSTCELSYHIINALGWESDIDEFVAECFYSGIITDTGSLSYNSSHPRTYLAVAELVGKGIDKNKIHKELFQSNSMSRMRLLGHVLCNKLEVLDECQAAFIAISKDELDRYGYQPGDTEGFVNYPLGIQGVDISAMLTEKEKDKFVKLSFRSRDNIPVNQYSEQYFSGGGHVNAAGGEWNGTLDEAVERLKNTLPGFVRKIPKL
jgi:phosphoesterase RecJ-like protein